MLKWFLAGTVILIITVVMSMPDAATPPAVTPQPPGLVLLDEPSGKIGDGYITITGRVKNNSPKPVGYANINFTIFNEAGEAAGDRGRLSPPNGSGVKKETGTS